MYQEAQRQEGAEAGPLLYSGAHTALAPTAQTLEQPDKEAEATLWRKRCAELEAHLEILTASTNPPTFEHRTQEARTVWKTVVNICDAVKTIDGADKELSNWALSLSRHAGFFMKHLRQVELSSLVWTLENICLTLKKCSTSHNAIGALQVAVSQEGLSLSGISYSSDPSLSPYRDSGQSSSSFNDVCGHACFT